MAKLALGGLSFPGLDFGRTNLRSLFRGGTTPRRRRGGGGGGGGSGYRGQAIPDAIHTQHLTTSEKEAVIRSPRYQKMLDKMEARAIQRQGQEMQFRKQVFDQMKEEHDQNKDLTYKWIELINNARSQGNTVLEEHLLAQGHNFISSLDDRNRQLLAPMLRSGPFDPQAAKLRQYDKINPRRAVTADRNEDPNTYAAQIMDDEKWKIQREAFISGRARPMPKVIPIGNDEFVTDLGGTPGIANEEILGLQNFAKRTGGTLGEVLTYGGTKGDQREVVLDGTKYQAYDLVRYPDYSVGQVMNEKGKTKTHEDAKKFTFEWQAWESMSTKDQKKKATSIVGQAKRMMDKQDLKMPEISEGYLKPMFGRNFIEVDADDADPTVWNKEYTWIAPGEDKYLLAVPGERDSIENIPVYYDTQNDRVFATEDATYLGTRAEATESLKQMNLLRSEREALEKAVKIKGREELGRGFGPVKSRLGVDIFQTYKPGA